MVGSNLSKGKFKAGVNTGTQCIKGDAKWEISTFLSLKFTLMMGNVIIIQSRVAGALGQEKRYTNTNI